MDSVIRKREEEDEVDKSYDTRLNLKTYDIRLNFSDSYSCCAVFSALPINLPDLQKSCVMSGDICAEESV